MCLRSLRVRWLRSQVQQPTLQQRNEFEYITRSPKRKPVTRVRCRVRVCICTCVCTCLCVRRRALSLLLRRQGWGVTSTASPTWMTLEKRDMKFEREPYEKTAYAGQTFMCVHACVCVCVCARVRACMCASRLVSSRVVSCHVVAASARWHHNLPRCAHHAMRSHEVCEHKSRPVWSQAPVLPDRDASSEVGTQHLRPEYAGIVRTRSEPFFDTANGTALAKNPFNLTLERVKTGSGGGGGSPSSTRTSDSRGSARDTPTSDTSRGDVTPTGTSRSSARRPGTGVAEPGSSRLPISPIRVGGGAAMRSPPFRSPLSPAAGEVLRVTTPKSRPDLFVPVSGR